MTVHSIKRRASNGRRIARLLAGLFAVVVLLTAGPLLVESLRVRAWPTAPGRIVTVEETEELAEVRVNRRSNSTLRERRLRLRFEYPTGQGTRIATHLFPTADFVRSTSANRARYAVGQTAMVRVSPDGTTAVWEAPFPVGALLSIIVSLLLVGWAARPNRVVRHRDDDDSYADPPAR